MTALLLGGCAAAAALAGWRLSVHARHWAKRTLTTIRVQAAEDIHRAQIAGTTLGGQPERRARLLARDAAALERLIVEGAHHLRTPGRRRDRLVQRMAAVVVPRPPGAPDVETMGDLLAAARYWQDAAASVLDQEVAP